ncbi:hypothetical protein K439DRAFT_824696 [Ramaria rubella]|nr:hypothetical protein K439DRAFT_824696 [Ramaria rubella]
MRTRIATQGLRSYAADEIKEMHRARYVDPFGVHTNTLSTPPHSSLTAHTILSLEHRKNMIHLEEEYAEYGRKIKRNFEEQNKITESIDRCLRQAVLDHDKNGLSKTMPAVLVMRPKIFQNLSMG